MQSWLAFKIWYANGSTYTGTSFTDWQNAPATGVQVIVFYQTALDKLGRHQRIIYKGLSYYGMDSAGSVTSAVSDGVGLGANAHVLTGSDMDFKAYVGMVEAAHRDFGWGWLVAMPTKPPGVKEDWHVPNEGVRGI